MVKRIKIKIYGMVQGVSFRYYTSLEARRLGITGWVKNMGDGSVHCEAEGEKEILKEFLNLCWEGSSLAKVDKVEHEYFDKLKNYTDFKISY